jgi:hypothetical protein
MMIRMPQTEEEIVAKGGCLAGIDFQTALELSTAVTLKYSLLEAIKPKRLETESSFLV